MGDPLDALRDCHGLGRYADGPATVTSSGQLFQVIGEGEGLSALLKAIDRRGLPVRMVGQIEGGDDAQAVGSQALGPLEETDRVVKGVMRPVNEGGLRIDFQNRLVQPQVVAVVRSQHQPVAGKAHGIAVRIFRRMDDFDPGHGGYYTNGPLCSSRAAL
jgi:hypothetical protein